MQVYDVEFTKKDLAKLAESERTLVFQLGHACNEIAFLHKLLIAVSDTEKDGIEQTAATAQAMIVIRLFTGKVFEAWLMLGKQYFGSDLKAKYEDHLPQSAKESLSQLRKRVGSKGLLAKVRNKFAFHYAPEYVEEVLALMDEEHPLRLISGGSYDSTLYSFSETAVTYGMLNLTNETSLQKAMDAVVADLVVVSGALLDFSSLLLGTILERQLGLSFDIGKWESHEVQVEHDLDSFRIPFFFARKSSREQV